MARCAHIKAKAKGEKRKNRGIANMEPKKKFGYKNTTSKRGGFSSHISAPTAQRLARYCKATSTNRTRFVEQCVMEKLDQVEIEFLRNLSKDELIELYLNK